MRKLPILLVLVLAACSSDGGGDGSISLTVSTSVGANGSISPASVTVNQNNATSFTVTPDAGFMIDTISGCGGSLAGNTYTTGAITADCTVSVTFLTVTTMAITDVFVHNHANGVFPNEEYKPIVKCDPDNPECLYQTGGFDVNAGIGGDTVSIWIRQEEVAEISDNTVITDVLVNHWSSGDAWFLKCPVGYEPASGNNVFDSALTTRTEGSCRRMGLCVRTAMIKDAVVNRPLATMNLNWTNDGSVASPAIATIDGYKVIDGEGFRRASVSRDIHEDCGGAFVNIVGYKTEPDSALLPKPEMDVVLRPDLAPDPSKLRTISLAENGFPLDYHSIWGFRAEHLQAMIRLPDRNGKEYYMGTFSQDCEGGDCGMVFVGEVPSGESSGIVTWMDFLDGSHPALGFNHPGDLHRIGDYVIVAGQNWHTWFMDHGGGGQTVLFYDVSDPASPSYVGKMNTCWQGDEIKSNSGEIDSIGAAKLGSTYYLSFNNLRCKSDSFHPYAHWEVVAEAGGNGLRFVSPAKFVHEGITYVGVAESFADLFSRAFGIRWQAYTDDFATLTEVLNVARLFNDYSPDAKAVSTLPDGTYCAISTDVESDVGMNFRVSCN